MKKTSLADIAKALGVSKTLVSLVLNDKGDALGINKETQRKVIAKARELNYRPNQFARGLRMGKSNTIGLIVSDIANSFYARICRSAEDHAAAHGYNLFICSADENVEKESRLIQMLINRQVDGLIISSTQSKSAEFTQLKKMELPFVLIDRHFPRLDTNYVIVDNHEGALKGVKHLIDEGHTKIGYLAISPAHLITIKERARGYKDALKEAGIRFDGRLVKDIPHDDVRPNVYKAMDELLSANSGVTAVFSSNNSLTIAAMEYLKEKGLHMPEDISLVSFDDIDLFKLSDPPITAVAQPIEEIGAQATEVLIQKIKEMKEQKHSTDHVVLETELLVRGSSQHN